MSASLVLIRHDGKQVEVSLKHAKTILGRHTDCQVRIPDASVSRQHCEVSMGEGRLMIRDLGSSNGTFVNRRRISSTELAPADLINIGKFIFVARIDGKPELIDSADALEEGMATQAPSTSAPAASGAPVGAGHGSSNHGSGHSSGLGSGHGGAKLPPPTRPPAPSKGSLMDANSDSSVLDFDFLDEKNAPKL